MTLQFDAYSAWMNFKDDYLDFIRQELGSSDLVTSDQMIEMWTQQAHSLFAPLHVQAAFPFKPSKTIHEIESLHPRAKEVLERAGISYKLFEHQVQAIEAARAGKTVVISAGTGSGKTESFLFPIINDLFHAHDEGRDDLSQPGVRALIVYPLNALVNNQVQRLAELLGDESPLKFAFYTGRLKEKRRDAEKYYKERGIRIPACQIIDRETLRDSPPHILVTNFSMLHYMLVRPKDRPLFMSEKVRFGNHPKLRSIVLDEAHVYAGAQADEIHLLLRRTAQRFETSLEKIQGFATSATLSTDGALDVLVNYAAGMFDTNPKDVTPILGNPYLPHVEPRQLSAEPTLNIVNQHVPEIRTLQFDESGRATEFTQSEAHVETLRELAQSLGLIVGNELDGVMHPAIAAHIICQHPRVCELREWFYARSSLPTLEEVAKFLYGSMDAAALKSTYLVLHIGSLARLTPGEHPVLPARLHAFVRAPAGVWLGLGPNAGVVAGLPPEKPEEAFAEVVRCQSCNAHYLRAFETTDDWGERIFTCVDASQVKESSTRIFRLTDSGAEVPNWGVQIRHITGLCEDCDEDLEPRGMVLGYEQSLGPIVDAVFPQLASYPAEDASHLPGHGRRMMTFSDSRRDAARVAASLETTHDRGLGREILWRALGEESKSGEDLIEDVMNMRLTLKQLALLQDSQADSDVELQLRKDAARVVFYSEFGRPTSALSLESLGIVRVDYPRIPARPQRLSQITDEEWSDLVGCLMDGLRSLGCVKCVDLGDFEDLNINMFLGKSVSINGQGASRAWILERGKHSPFWRFVERVAASIGIDTEELMNEVWTALTTQPPPWWVESDPDAYMVDVRRLKFQATAPTFKDSKGRALHRSFRGFAPRTNQVIALDAEEQDRWMSEHRVKRVVNGKFLGLWTFEHTAQIAPDELEMRETAFRVGKLNLLASSTTLEMGVDLGGLTFIMLTNMPPGPSNYWQRAGRAGRRADGSSLVLSLARERPHDQKAFADPRAYLSGKIVPPAIRGDGEPLVRRHINSLLLGEFFWTQPVDGPGGNPLHAFGHIKEFASEQGGVFENFVKWLGSLDESVRQHMNELKLGTCLEHVPDEELITDCVNLITHIVAVYRTDESRLLKEIQKEADKSQSQKDGLLLGALNHQLKNLHRELLIPYLSRYEFLPRFGFPIDVVRLDTTCLDQVDGKSSVEEELRMERSLTLALAEYVPGHDVLARKRVYRVQGLIKDWDDPMAKHKYLLTCRDCGAQRTSDTLMTSCPVCNTAAPMGGLQGDGANVQMFIEPGGMAVAMRSKSKRYAGPPSVKRARFPARALVLKSNPEWRSFVGEPRIELGWLPESRLLTRTEYPMGFAICPNCGFTEPEITWDKVLPEKVKKGHTRLRGEKPCNGQFWRNYQLGTHTNVDALLIRFPGRLKWSSLENQAAVTTFAACAQQVVAEFLQVESRTLQSLFHVSTKDELWAAVVEDSGAGFLGTVLDRSDEFLAHLMAYFETTDALSFVRFENQFLANTHLFRLDLAAQILS